MNSNMAAMQISEMYAISPYDKQTNKQSERIQN